MRRVLLIIILHAFTVSMLSQKVVLSGIVCSDKTGERLPQATITIEGTNLSVVTNDEGFFTLKVNAYPKNITVSHIGYQSYRQDINAEKPERMLIRLKPRAIQLQEVIVMSQDPRDLVNLAIQKIPVNYSRQAELLNCFYRETAMKRKHFIYVAEGVVDMYKTGYGHGDSKDRVAIRKGRRLLSPAKNDTLSVKVLGGPVQPIQLDIVKNLDFLLNEEELSHYAFKMEEPTTIGNRLQYVVSISPNVKTTYALYYGKLYIDCETVAFTRAELTLDMSDREKATRLMLVKKPAGVKFKPKEMACLIDYRYDNGVTRINYIRSTFRFNCDWKRRLFATSFSAFCEMVVTDNTRENVVPISGRNSFDSRDAFFDRVDYFRDPNFWEDYNIIEPTETLDKAINKLIKKYK